MDKKMKVAYAGLMLVLMVSVSIGIVVADTMDYAILTGNDELAQAAASVSTFGGLLIITVLFRMFLIDYLDLTTLLNASH